MSREGKVGLKDREEEEAGSSFPSSPHGNLSTASSDDCLKDILRSVRSSKSPAVVYYGASWCRVCSQILPAFCKFSNDFKNLKFIYADIDECPDTTQNIRYRPTFIVAERGLTRCLAQERRDCMIGCGYTLKTVKVCCSFHYLHVCILYI